MSMFFRCYGYLHFEDKEKAKQNFDLLTTTNDSLYNYFPEELELIGSKIYFKSKGNFSAYSTCEKTCDIVYQVAEKSYNGDVKIDEGDGENNMWSWRSYKVRSATLYYMHTAPKKVFLFKGQLEFENETLCRSACKLLTTDTKNSIFTKYTPNQIVFTNDRRVVYFKNKILYIDVQCAGDEKVFKSTQKIIGKLKAIKGNVACNETVCLRHIPINTGSSIDWVNDMKKSIFYNFSGSFTFKTTKEAENSLNQLLTSSACLFKDSAKKTFPLYVSGVKLFFDDNGKCARSLFNKTGKLIEKIGSTALRGKVEAAFSIFENMDVYVVDRSVPSKIRRNQ